MRYGQEESSNHFDGLLNLLDIGTQKLEFLDFVNILLVLLDEIVVTCFYAMSRWGLSCAAKDNDSKLQALNVA